VGVREDLAPELLLTEERGAVLALAEVAIDIAVLVLPTRHPRERAGAAAVNAPPAIQHRPLSSVLFAMCVHFRRVYPQSVKIVLRQGDEVVTLSPAGLASEADPPMFLLVLGIT
jgi:hypothetical protein